MKCNEWRSEQKITVITNYHNVLDSKYYFTQQNLPRKNNLNER